MIILTRLNGEPLHINAAQIESLEANPDTRVTLMNGRQIYVRERPEEVCAAMRIWFRSLQDPHISTGTAPTREDI